MGCPWHVNRGRNDQDGVFYRFFGPDPIAFHSSISFTTGCREDDTESVLYYYRILGSKAPRVPTPLRWQFTDPFGGGNTWEGFNKQEFVENIPAGDWPEIVNEGEQSKRSENNTPDAGRADGPPRRKTLTVRDRCERGRHAITSSALGARIRQIERIRPGAATNMITRAMMKNSKS